jgi:hypothetical protein
MGKLQILEKKSFSVGDRLVKVYRLDVIGAEKPHQVAIRTKVDGIKKQQTSCFCPAAIVNRDFEYFEFELAQAEKFVTSFLRFLNTAKGKKLSAE